MSAPSLPEAFGNYALGDFVEVVSPGDISWLPQTVGWKVLGLALLGLALYRSWKALRLWYRNRYRREAAARLQQWSQQVDGPLLAGDINQLLKLTALVAFPREQVAGLHGANWVEFLNSQCEVPPFDGNQAEVLAVGTYRNLELEDRARSGMIAASQAWVREHVNPLDD